MSDLMGIMTVKKVMYYSDGYAIVQGTTETTEKSGGMTFKGKFDEYTEDLP